MRKRIADLPHVGIYILLHCKSLVDVEINKLTMTVSNHTAAFSGNKKIYCESTHHGRIYTVLTCRASTTLHVTKDSCTCLDCLLYTSDAADDLYMV